jgi:hypothetical protein
LYSTVIFGSFVELVAQLLHALEDFDGRKLDMHTSEPLVLEPRPFDVEFVVENHPGIDTILSELIKAKMTFRIAPDFSHVRN